MRKKTAVLIIGLLVAVFPLLAFQASAFRLNIPVSQVNIQGVPAAFTFSAAIGDQTNQSYETVIVRDKNGSAVPNGVFDFYYSDSASGQGITATASSSTSGLLIGTGTGSATGTLLGVTAATPTVATSRISMRIMADSNGKAVIGVLDSGKTLYYPCAAAWQAGTPKCGTRLTAGNYK